MATHFNAAGLKFLKDLAKHNDRDWFTPRKETFERELKAPLYALIGEINDSLIDFAPEHIRPPQKAALRIYRDIRFSANKAPYKTHVAAWWSRDGMEKTSGAGFYLSISPERVMVAAGVYMPERMQLLAIRRHLVEHHAAFRAILESRKMKSAFQEFEGAKLTRPPKGFQDVAPEAMDLILCKQWGVSSALPAEEALKPTLRKMIVDRFRTATPMVEMLNAPLAPKPRKPMF